MMLSKTKVEGKSTLDTRSCISLDHDGTQHISVVIDQLKDENLVKALQSISKLEQN